MAEVKKVYSQKLPAMRFIGKGYSECDKVNGTFGNKWAEWFEQRLFDPLKLSDIGIEPFEGSDAYIGLCRCKENEPFRYYIGAFLPVDTAVPEGYEYIDFDEGEVAVIWIYGKEPDIYSFCCMDSLHRENYEWKADNNGIMWCFERYVRPRFTEPDDNGNVILDMCFYI